MSELKSEILRSLLESDEYVEDMETSHYKKLESLLEDSSNKFCESLPLELQSGFKAITEMYTTLCFESREIGQAIGLKIAYAVLDLLHNPEIPLERLMQTYPKAEDMTAVEINKLEASLANYKKEREEADT